ncbi:hypothetical protein CYMTET_20400 [Cymbomonas tetramitiformis]|uniref:Reverse transcriptase domain-containing protein n=1 Tax=Cymbomonas tetramitiformis TaxID=36881 RepID=A0AAE0G457_9CHLO|nr:hypothetical protein CYMTET_20400 [Cymbomonas tetramitiformis]
MGMRQQEQVDAARVNVSNVAGPVIAEEQVVPPAQGSPSPCEAALQDGLQSSPVPEGLAELLRTPGVVPGSGVSVEAEADGAEQGQQERVADAVGTPRPSPGMERRLYVGPLFQPDELIGLDQRVGQEVQLFAANMVAAARQGLQPPGRVPGALGSVGPDVEYLSEDGQLVLSRRGGRIASRAAGSRSPRPDAASRGGSQPPEAWEGVDVVSVLGEDGSQGSDAEVGAGGAQRQERPVDPVIPEASWEWLRSLPLSEVFACPFSSARHVPKRAKDEFAGVLRWILRSLDGDSEDFWRLLGVAPRMLLVPPPGARKKSIPAELVRGRVARLVAGEWEALYSAAIPSAPVWPARASEERVMSDVISLVKEVQLGKAVRRFDSGVLAPLTPETLEALQALHPVGEGLPASVQAALLVLEEAAVEAECRQMPVALGPGCSQLRFEHLDAVFGAGDGVPAIQHACEQIVSSRIPAGVQPWIMGARQMKTRFAAHFGAPPEASAVSSAAQVGVGVRGGAEFEWIRSAEGTQQGDPLGPFFMAAPLQPVLREILRAHPEVYIIAYLDDIHILGEPERVREAYDTAVPLLADIGLELNVRKNAVFSPSGACEAFQDVVDAGGVPMLGALVPLEGGGGPYPLGEEAVALSQLPTRWGGLGLTSAQRLAPAGWLGSWAHVWKRVVVMFLAVRGLLPHLGAPVGTDAGGHPLVGGSVSAMEDVLGARERVLAARAEGHALPEALKVPEEAPRCGGVVDEFGFHYLACNRMGMSTYRHDAVPDVLVEMLRNVFDPASVKRTH